MTFGALGPQNFKLLTCYFGFVTLVFQLWPLREMMKRPKESGELFKGRPVTPGLGATHHLNPH